MREHPEHPDLLAKIQRDIATRMRDLDLAIDAYAKLLIELELLEIEALQVQRSNPISTRRETRSE